MSREILDIFKDVESSETSNLLSLSSGTRVFLEMLSELPVSSKLLTLLRDKENAQSLISRVAELVDMHVDLSYRNPHDIALAIYLWSLWRVDKRFADLVIGWILETPNTWWSYLIAQMIWKKMDNKTASSYSYQSQIKLNDNNLTNFVDLVWNQPAYARNIFVGGLDRVRTDAISSDDMRLMTLIFSGQGKLMETQSGIPAWLPQNIDSISETKVGELVT